MLHSIAIEESKKLEAIKTMEKGKKIIGPLEWVSLIAGFLILGYILVRCGCNPVNRVESTEIVNNPGHAWGENRRTIKSSKKKSVDPVLEQIAKQFSNGKKPDYRAFREKGITKDEINFYDQLKKEYGGEIDHAKNWYKVLKTAKNTYQSVGDLFADATGQPAETLRSSDLQEILDHPEKSAKLFNQFARRFNKSSGEIEDFARRAPGKLSDWAIWLEER